MSDNSTPTKIADGLKVYSAAELEAALCYQRENYGWDFNSERELMENLFCQRFNFLLVIYSLFVTAAATTTSQQTLNIVLTLGALLTILVCLTIWRAYVKLIVNLRILYNLPQHAFEFIGAEVKELGARGLFGVNSIIGLWVPIFCGTSLAMGAALAWAGVIKAG